MSRHELSDEQWSRLEPLLAQHGRGRRCSNLRRVANGILWLLRTGAPWRDLPGEYGAWKTVYYHFSRWRDDGMWDRVMGELQLELLDAGMLDLDLWCVDGSNIRASRAAAGARKKGGGGGKPRIMPWVVQEEAMGRNYTWLPMAMVSPWPPSSAQANDTNQSTLKPSWMLPI